MLRVLLVVSLLVVFAVPVAAQMPYKPISLYIQGGVSLPQSDFEKGYKMAYQGSAGLGLKLVPALEAVARVSYHSFEPDYSDSLEIDGGRFTALLYGGEAKLNMGQTGFALFMVAGAGFAKLDLSDVEMQVLGRTHTVKTDSQTKSYFTFGAGLEFERLFVEARYVKILDDIKFSELSTNVDEDNTIVFIPLSVGLKF